MSSFSIKSISQLNLSLNIDNKKNIENIQIIINDLKELIDILSFRISDVSTSKQQQIDELDQEIDNNFPDFSGDVTGGDSGTGGGTESNETNAVVGYFN